jgi:hypothetical protein
MIARRWTQCCLHCALVKQPGGRRRQQRRQPSTCKPSPLYCMRGISSLGLRCSARRALSGADARRPCLCHTLTPFAQRGPPLAQSWDFALMRAGASRPGATSLTAHTRASWPSAVWCGACSSKTEEAERRATRSSRSHACPDRDRRGGAHAQAPAHTGTRTHRHRTHRHCTHRHCTRAQAPTPRPPPPHRHHVHAPCVCVST